MNSSELMKDLAEKNMIDIMHINSLESPHKSKSKSIHMVQYRAS